MKIKLNWNWFENDLSLNWFEREIFVDEIRFEKSFSIDVPVKFVDDDDEWRERFVCCANVLKLWFVIELF